MQQRDQAERARRLLVVAQEWFPGRGGIAAFNRRLCRALAEAGAEVYCLVPEIRDGEAADAEAAGVHLIEARHGIGISPGEAMIRRPGLPAGWIPDAVIGHGRVTGPIARTLVEDHFPQAARLHFPHVEPDRSEWEKLGRPDDAAGRAMERTRLEIDLARDASRVFAIGPVLEGWLQRDLGVYRDVPAPVRIDPGFDDRTEDGIRVPPAGKPLILLLGRMEDPKIKGFFLAARSVGLAMSMGARPKPWQLLVRGAPAGEGEDLRRQALDLAGHPLLEVVTRNFSEDPAVVQEDFRRASLGLVPSLVDAFALAGLESIIAGVPLLVSDQAGLGQVLREVLDPLDPELAERVVVPVTGSDEVDLQRWACAIAAVMRDRPAAFATAEAVRSIMAKHRTWSYVARRVLDCTVRREPHTR